MEKNNQTNEVLEVNEVVEVNNEMIIKEDVATNLDPAIFENTNTVLYSSIKAVDRATSIKVYNAINNSERAISDCIGEVLEITDMVAHPVQFEDERTGEKINAMRVVLLNKQGLGYHTVSNGVVSSLQKLIGIVGQAPWTPAIKIVPVEVKTRKGFKTITLRLQA